MRIPSGRFRRAAIGAVVAAALGPLVLACNDADTFADEYSAYLRSQPAVETFTVRPNNTIVSAGSVDSAVRLRSGMSDDDAAATIRTIATHRVGDSRVTNRIRTTVPSVNGSSKPADVTLMVIPGSSNPRTGDPSTIPHWVQRTRALAASDAEVTAIDLWADAMHADTAASAYPLAQRLDDFVAAEAAGLKRMAVAGDDCNVQWDSGDRLAALAPYLEVLAALRPVGVRPVHCRVSSQRPLTEPSLFMTLPRGTDPAVLEALQTRAAQLGLAADITIGA